MSRRRRASELMFGTKRGLLYPVKIVAAASGTGTIAAKGVFTVVASSGAGDSAHGVYLTVSSGTNIGTLVGTYSTGV